MYTPKIRELIRKNFKEDPTEAKSIATVNCGFSLLYNDMAYMSFTGQSERLDSTLLELGYIKSRAEKEIGHNLPDKDFVECGGRPTSSVYTMYINKTKGTAVLRERGWIHYTSGACGYNKWDTFTVYNLLEN